VVILKSEEEIEKLYVSNQIVAEGLKLLKSMAIPGMKTKDLDREVENFILKKGAIPAFKNFDAGGSTLYPASVCISINNEVVHGIPGRRKLKDGDIVSFDLGVLNDGFYGDSAITVPVGNNVTEDAKKLIRVTEESLRRAIEKCRIGCRVGDISRVVQGFVEGEGFSVVRTFTGHGIGQSLHEEPYIPNYFDPKMNGRLREGLVLALEPMVNFGSHETRILRDGWTCVTADGSLSAHFEHSIAITKDGPRVLSMRA